MKKLSRLTQQVQSMSRGFPLLFDPRTPILFVLGGVLMEIVGSASYDLLVQWLGSGWRTALIAGAGSLMLLIIVVIAIYMIASSHSTPGDILGPEEKASPRPGLVVFLSPGTGKGDEQALLYHKDALQHVWLLVTDDVEEEGKAERLAMEYRQAGIQVYTLHLANPRDAGEARDLVLSALAEARRRGLARDALYVDITSCLRPAAMGATLACWQTGHDIEYMIRPYEKGQLVPGPSEAMKVALSLSVTREEAV